MNRKSLMIAALVFSSGSTTWAADPAPAAPGFVVPAPAAAAPAAATPTADATATTPDAAPSTQPTAPDPATMGATLLKMGMEGASRNWKGLASDVGTMEPVRNALPAQQQAMLDGFAGMLKSQGIAVPGMPTTDPTATGDATASGSTDATGTGQAALVSNQQGAAPQATPAAQSVTTPATADSTAVPVINQAISDVSAGQSSGQLARDAQSLVGVLGKSLTTSTQQSAQAALMSASSTVIGRVAADIQARNVNAAKSDLRPLASVNGLPASITQQINSLKQQIKALSPTNSQKNQNQQQGQTPQKKHKN